MEYEKRPLLKGKQHYQTHSHYYGSGEKTAFSNNGEVPHRYQGRHITDST